jgi:hypothetical protein
MGNKNVQRVLSGIVGIALLVGACGDDDDEDGSGDTVAPTENSAAGADDEPEPEPEPEPEDAVGSQDEPQDTSPPEETDPPQTDAPAQGGGSADEWCGVLPKSDDVEMFFDNVTSLSPEELESGIMTIQAELPAFAGAAPPEIQQDVMNVIDQAEDIFAALAEANYNFLDLDPSALDNPEAAQEADASQWKIDEYSNENCGRPFGDQSPEPTDDPVSEPEDGSFDPEAGTIREQVVADLVASGYTEQEANCLVEKIDFSNPEAYADQEALLAIFTECGISLERLGEFGG